MVIANINSLESVSISHGAEHPILIHGIRNAGGPAGGEPVRIMLTENEALALIAALSNSLPTLE